MCAKILAVVPGGGHLCEARIALESVRESDVVYVTTPLPHLVNPPYQRNILFITNPHLNIFKYAINFFQSIWIYLKTRPEFILCTGGGQCIALFLIGKLLGSKTIFIESGSRIRFPSRTGKLLYRFSDYFYVQSADLLAFYPGAQLVTVL